MTSALGTHRSDVEVAIVILRDSSYIGPCLHESPGQDAVLFQVWREVLAEEVKAAKLGRRTILVSDNLKMNLSRHQCQGQGGKKKGSKCPGLWGCG